MSRQFGATVNATLRSRVVRVAGVLVAVYFALWGLTQWLGVPRVRAAVAREHLPSPQEVRLPDRVAECWAVAIAPFLIDAGYYWHLDTLIGEGGSARYAWFGGSGIQLWEGPKIVE